MGRENYNIFVKLAPLPLGEVWEYEKILPIKISKISLFYSIFISTTPLKARSDKGSPPYSITRVLAVLSRICFSIT